MAPLRIVAFRKDSYSNIDMFHIRCIEELLPGVSPFDELNYRRYFHGRRTIPSS